MLRKSYYSTLGVASSESAAGIRQAFREVAKRYHPDRVGLERSRYFQEAVEAYRVLADPERRRDYDRGLYHAELQTSAVVGPIALKGLEGSLPLALPVLRVVVIKDAPFEAALARISGDVTTAEIRGSDYCEDLNTALILSANEALRGGVIVLVVPSCSPCDRCGGCGRHGLFPCPRCDGEGLIEEQEIVRVHIMPGAGDGGVVNVPLRGLGVHNFYLRLHIRVASDMSADPTSIAMPRMSSQ